MRAGLALIYIYICVSFSTVVSSSDSDADQLGFLRSCWIDGRRPSILPWLAAPQRRWVGAWQSPLKNYRASQLHACVGSARAEVHGIVGAKH
jgi:hypothetical protein